MDFPDWINQDVKDLFEILNDAQIELRTPPFGRANSILLKSLTNKLKKLEGVINSDECEDVWLESEILAGDKNGQLWLAYTILRSTPNPSEGTHRKSEAEIADWSKEVIKTCEKLNNLLGEQCPDEKRGVQFAVGRHIEDDIIDKCGIDDGKFIYTKLREALGEDLKKALEENSATSKLIQNINFALSQDITFACITIDMQKAIDGIISEINDSCPKQTFWPNQVHGENIDRAYFIRSLTNAYYKKTKQPHRSKVRAITNAAQFNPINDDSVLRRLTSDIIKNNDEFEDITGNHLASFLFFVSHKEQVLNDPGALTLLPGLLS